MTRMDPRMAQRRRRVQETHARRRLRRLVRVLGVLAIAAAVVWVFRSPLLAVQNIEVAGASQVDVLAVLREAGITGGVAMMDVDTDVAHAALLDDRWVESAEVRRDWPQTISVEVLERVPVAWVSADDGWHHVARDGVSLVRADQPNLGEPAIIFPAVDVQSLVGDPDLVGLLDFVAALPPKYRAATTIASDTTGFVGRVAGFEVRLGSGEQGREKALALAAILETRPEEGSIITMIAPGEPAVLPPGSGGEDGSTDSTGENPEGG